MHRTGSAGFRRALVFVTAALLWTHVEAGQKPADWERQAAAGLDTLLGSEAGVFDQAIYDATLHDIDDLHTDPEMVQWHVEHARLKLKIELQQQELRDRRAALQTDARRREADTNQRMFNYRAGVDGIWTAEEVAESDRLHDIAVDAWQPSAAEEMALAAYDAMRLDVVATIQKAAMQMGGLSPDEVAARSRNVLLFDAATRTWRKATFTGQMVDQVQRSIAAQREVGIRATNVMFAAQIFMERTDITEEERAVAQQVHDMAYRTRGFAAEAISKDLGLIMFGTTADIALLGVGRPVSWVGGKVGQGVRSLWTRLFGEAAETAGTSAATAGTTGTAAAAAGETATTVRIPHAEVGTAAAASRTGSAVAPEVQAIYARALQKAEQLGVRADEIKNLEEAMKIRNPAVGVEARQILHALDDVERVITNARAAGVAEAEIQAALARARATGTPEAFVYQLGDDLAAALANGRGVTVLVAPHEAAAFAEFTKHVPVARVLQMDAAALVRLETKLRLASRGNVVDWTAAERVLIEQIGTYIRQGGGANLLKWAEFTGLDKLTPVFRADFVKLFEQAFGTTAGRAAAEVAPTVRLGAEATAPTVRLGAEATAPTVRLPPPAGAKPLVGAAVAGAGLVAGTTAEAAEAKPASTSTTASASEPLSMGFLDFQSEAEGFRDPNVDPVDPPANSPEADRIRWATYFGGSEVNPPEVETPRADPRVQLMLGVIDDLDPVVSIAEPAPQPASWVARATGGILHALQRLVRHPSALRADISRAPVRPLPGEAWDQAKPAGPAQAPPIKMFMTSLGTSTGEAFEVLAANDGDTPVRLTGALLVLEPIEQRAQAALARQVQRVAGSGDATALRMNAYCLQFLKGVPAKGTVFRVARQELQEQFAPIRHIVRAARDVFSAGDLTPDTTDAKAYFHSIRQWAIWAREQRFTFESFREAFVQHTRKNVEAAGQQWTPRIGEAVAEAARNRWANVTAVLQAADRLAATTAPVPVR